MYFFYVCARDVKTRKTKMHIHRQKGRRGTSQREGKNKRQFTQNHETRTESMSEHVTYVLVSSLSFFLHPVSGVFLSFPFLSALVFLVFVLLFSPLCLSLLPFSCSRVAHSLFVPRLVLIFFLPSCSSSHFYSRPPPSPSLFLSILSFFSINNYCVHLVSLTEQQSSSSSV